MACPAIITGDQFLLRVIGHIDCQAQVLGSYGYQALGQPGSPASTLMAGLLTLFVALFGIRLLFGPPPGARDTVFDVIKIGLVLTLAFSWPAFRTVIHDVVLDGPAQIAASILPSSFAQADARFAERLQQADVNMVRLTELGTGRNAGEYLPGSESGGSFAGTGLQDDAAFGYGRFAYLSGIIASLGLLRLLAAFLLALAPFAAGLLLFEQTRGIFAGWLRGLVLATIGSVGATAVLALQLTILEPWLADAMRMRGLGYAIPSAPSELLAINMAFSVIQFAMIWLIAKIAFNRGWMTLPVLSSLGSSVARIEPYLASQPQHALAGGQSRVDRISQNVDTLVRREHYSEQERLRFRSLTANAPPDARQDRPSEQDRIVNGGQPLGSSFRRSSLRSSGASRKRDLGI